MKRFAILFAIVAVLASTVFIAGCAEECSRCEVKKVSPCDAGCP